MWLFLACQQVSLWHPRRGIFSSGDFTPSDPMHPTCRKQASWNMTPGALTLHQIVRGNPEIPQLYHTFGARLRDVPMGQLGPIWMFPQIINFFIGVFHFPVSPFWGFYLYFLKYTHGPWSLMIMAGRSKGFNSTRNQCLTNGSRMCPTMHPPPQSFELRS